ncbi:MAG: aminoacyl-tRNA hydrolase [Chloroflexi bacterium]|nr:aminoacyl-tRNA hydrolase [Chloroflexota bacterium]MBI5292056.1 aminoacyl-tRNA hydrolase [Chloroflexota bacterium]
MTKHLIIGLGNPGRDYANNRHNVGFMAVDRLAKTHNTAFTRRQGKALVTTVRLGEEQVVLAKPQTFMNLSGEAVQSLVKFYDVPLADLLICFDDIDLPTGAIRLRPEGGSAGQNGMKSIIAALGTQGFPRLRLGVGRPPGRMDAAAYVLQDFKGFDADVIDATLDKAVQAIETFVKDGIVTAMNRFNGSADGATDD